VWWNKKRARITVEKSLGYLLEEWNLEIPTWHLQQEKKSKESFSSAARIGEGPSR